jgi:hypothetical protein
MPIGRWTDTPSGGYASGCALNTKYKDKELNNNRISGVGLEQFSLLFVLYARVLLRAS